MSSPARFVVVEGFEGAGKGGLIENLQKILPAETTVFTREPGGTPLAEELRQILKHGENGAKADPITLMTMFWAARADHMHQVIKPALAQGKVVICDRFDASTYAYQVWGPQLLYLEDLFGHLRNTICCPEPHWYVYLDVDWLTGMRRSREAGTLDNFSQNSSKYHVHVCHGYKRFLEKYAGDRYTIIDANRNGKHLVLRDAVDSVLRILGHSQEPSSAPVV
jgi:dTMP kinase